MPRSSLRSSRQRGPVPIHGGTAGAGTPSRGLPGAGEGAHPAGRGREQPHLWGGEGGVGSGPCRCHSLLFPHPTGGSEGPRGHGGAGGGQMGGGRQPRPARLKIPGPPADLPARRRHPLPGIFLLPWQLVPGGGAGGAGKGLAGGSVPPRSLPSRRPGGGQGSGAGMCGMIPAGWGLDAGGTAGADPGVFPSGAAVSLPRAGSSRPPPRTLRRAAGFPGNGEQEPAPSP